MRWIAEREAGAAWIQIVIKTLPGIPTRWCHFYHRQRTKISQHSTGNRPRRGVDKFCPRRAGTGKAQDEKSGLLLQRFGEPINAGPRFSPGFFGSS
jgi:hypothetical protein